MAIKSKKNNGYVIVFAVLIGGMILTMTLAMVNFSVNQQIFTRDTRDGNKTFNVLSSVAECLLYQDRKVAVFPKDGGSATSFTCGSGTTISAPQAQGDGSYLYLVTVTPTDPTYCAEAKVYKNFVVGVDPNTSADLIGTTINTTAYNKACSVTLDIDKMVSRSIEYTYED